MRRIFLLSLLIIVFIFPSMPVSAQDKIYKTTTPLQVPRQMYGTVVLGNYLYVIGGNIQGKGEDPEGYVITVEKAHINPDGSLGQWEQTRPLPSNRSYIHNSTLALNDIVYILQNFNGLLYQGRVIFAEVNVKDFPQTSQQYGVFRVPNWIFFDNSRVIKFRQEGVLSLQALEAHIRSIAQ